VSANQYDEFVRGDDEQLYQRKNGGGWAKRGNGCMRSGPGAAYWSTTSISVFTRGCSDSRLYQIRYTGSWGNWSATHSTSCLLGSPAATSRYTNRIDVFVRGCDNGLYVTASTNGGLSWGGFTGIAGACLLSAPAAVATSSNRIDVVYRDCSDNIGHHWWVSGVGWDSETVTGCTTQAPGAASPGTSNVVVFVRGCGSSGPSSEVLYVNVLNTGNGWTGWDNLGGCLSSAPGGGDYAPYYFNALFRGCASPANSVWKTSWNWAWSTGYYGAWPP
jgi:hypothetical protein